MAEKMADTTDAHPRVRHAKAYPFDVPDTDYVYVAGAAVALLHLEDGDWHGARP